MAISVRKGGLHRCHYGPAASGEGFWAIGRAFARGRRVSGDRAAFRRKPVHADCPWGRPAARTTFPTFAKMARARTPLPKAIWASRGRGGETGRGAGHERPGATMSQRPPAGDGYTISQIADHPRTCAPCKRSMGIRPNDFSYISASPATNFGIVVKSDSAAGRASRTHRLTHAESGASFPTPRGTHLGCHLSVEEDRGAGKTRREVPAIPSTPRAMPRRGRAPGGPRDGARRTTGWGARPTSTPCTCACLRARREQAHALGRRPRSAELGGDLVSNSRTAPFGRKGMPAGAFVTGDAGPMRSRAAMGEAREKMKNLHDARTELLVQSRATTTAKWGGADRWSPSAPRSRRVGLAP